MPDTSIPPPTPQLDSLVKTALEKLTSEIFVFLLGYAALLGTLLTIGSPIPVEMQRLLTILPLAGILAYGWLRKKTVMRNPTARGIRVKALFVSNATVAGVEGPPLSGDATPDVDVRVGVARRGRVVGAGAPPPSRADSAYLEGLFERLSDTGKRAVIAAAQRQLNDEERRGR